MRKFLKASFNKGSENALMVEIFYLKNAKQRGYYGIVTPVEVKNSGGIQSFAYMMFSGARTLMQEVKKASAKVEQSLTMDSIKWLIERVARESGAVLEVDDNGAWVEV